MTLCPAYGPLNAAIAAGKVKIYIYFWKSQVNLKPTCPKMSFCFKNKNNSKTVVETGEISQNLKNFSCCMPIRVRIVTKYAEIFCLRRADNYP